MSGIKRFKNKINLRLRHTFLKLLRNFLIVFCNCVGTIIPTIKCVQQTIVALLSALIRTNFSFADPKNWSIDDVRTWLVWNSRQYNLPIVMELFNVTGAVLTTMSEQDFVQRTPQVSRKKKCTYECKWRANVIKKERGD